jgi:hypothetical protein
MPFMKASGIAFVFPQSSKKNLNFGFVYLFTRQTLDFVTFIFSFQISRSTLWKDDAMPYHNPSIGDKDPRMYDARTFVLHDNMLLFN